MSRPRALYHGPRATIIAPPGYCFAAFDADGIHLRIAACESQDPFIGEALRKYDETGDPVWKPHIQNCAALFSITPQEAIGLMKEESPKYTFAKNFIFLILNGGDVPALANAAVDAGLTASEGEVKKLLDAWLERAVLFKKWRESLVEEAETTGMLVLPSGRRRRFYGLRTNPDKSSRRKFLASHEVIKEIYNTPLLAGEVDFMNPRILLAYRVCQAWGWKFIYHGHDGFMCEGKEEEAMEFVKDMLSKIPTTQRITGTRTLYVPFNAKLGTVWAEMKEVK